VTGRLDTRQALYGELRLSDAQVLALRAAAGPGLTETRDGYSDGEKRFLPKVVTGRAMHHLLVGDMGGRWVASPRGHSVLCAIDASAAPSPAGSAS
jgi:hypothetical protein